MHSTGAAIRAYSLRIRIKRGEEGDDDDRVGLGELIRRIFALAWAVGLAVDTVGHVCICQLRIFSWLMSSCVEHNIPAIGLQSKQNLGAKLQG